MEPYNQICIHGHFYQPPRANPFTGRIPDQPTAAPYPNWNERITDECYRANTAARVLDENGQTLKTVNNYGWISFDFGPTLLSWLEDHAPETYRAILDADRLSAERFDGHGSAMAHAYNHTILPLSNDRDIKTQVRWGIADFRHRFGRPPEGMWLPETAVDLRTLRALADEGIVFTILSPYQAAVVLGDGGKRVDVSGGKIDTRVPYQVELPGGGSISVFFYNGPLSQEIAFNGLLDDGKILAKRLGQALGEPTGGHLLANVATDGESYGHHHRFGEMALAVAIEEIASDPEVRLTNYGEFLSRHPATRTAEIVEDSSWSCAHGVERWRSDCGCHSGKHPGWQQTWRAPLRESLDWLRDRLIVDFDRVGPTLLRDHWRARDDYIEVMLGLPVEEFLDVHAFPGLSERQRDETMGLLEIQHRAMLMYTSCGWFFDDIAGIEAVLVLRHAGRVINLARQVLGVDLEPDFLERLEDAPGNEEGVTGRTVWETEVSPYLSS